MNDKEIVISRLIDAPRERVWEAWTDPEQLITWWGPNGFTNTFHAFDFRVGGVWRFMMHGPDGVDYPNTIVFEEIIEPERIAYLHSGEEGDPEHVFHANATFEDVGGKTKVTLRLRFDKAEEREKSVKFGAVEGGNQTLGRLADHVAKSA
jgi:uncharacterized protein YndB with AHSA1/START domain